MKYAVVETGSKQYRVTPGMKLFVEKLDAKDGETITLDKIALLVDEDRVEIGTPYLNTSITAQVIKHVRDPKKVGLRYEGGSYRRRFGHRQHKTVIQIAEFGEAKKTAKKEEAVKES